MHRKKTLENDIETRIGIYVYAALPIEIQFFPLNYIHFAFGCKIGVENMYGTAVFVQEKEETCRKYVFSSRIQKY